MRRAGAWLPEGVAAAPGARGTDRGETAQGGGRPAGLRGLVVMRRKEKEAAGPRQREVGVSSEEDGGQARLARRECGRSGGGKGRHR